MIDIHSVEFYVVAFGIAIALVALIFGQRERGPATSRIVQLELEPGEGDATLSVTMIDPGLMAINRTGLHIDEGDTVNLVATIIDDKVHIAEKWGVKSGSGITTTFSGTARLPLKGKARWHVRYDSEVTGQWCLLSVKSTEGAQAQTVFKY